MASRAAKSPGSDLSASFDHPLPAVAIHALADLVAAGFGLTQALEALPRHTLSAAQRRELTRQQRILAAGGAIEPLLLRLGLDITAATLGSAEDRASNLESALRADAEARTALDEALHKTRVKIQLFGAVLAALVIVVVYLAGFLVPAMIRDIAAGQPEGGEMPAALAGFERFRDLWLMLGAGFVLSFVAVIALYAGLLGRDSWGTFLHDLRLNLPFLRAHAIHTSCARLLEALAHEGRIGLPVSATLRRVRQREKVPRLRQALALAAARLDAGEPWKTSLQGTLLDTPILADFAELAGRGARPIQGWSLAAARHRAESIKNLRRGMISAAVLVLVPTFLYLAMLLHTAAVSVSVAQLEAVNQEIRQLTDEVESLFAEEP